MITTSQINNKSLSMERPQRRSKQRLTKTELGVLGFLLMKIDSSVDVDLGYSVFASDKKLQKFTGKSLYQLHRALRHLEALGLLSSSHPKPFRGTAVLFYLTFPQYCQVRRLVGRGKGHLLAHYIYAYSNRTHNPISSAEIAVNFNVRKRTAQRAINQLVSEELMRPTHMWSWSRRRRRYVKIPAYELRREKPLTHWMERDV